MAPNYPPRFPGHQAAYIILHLLKLTRRRPGCWLISVASAVKLHSSLSLSCHVRDGSSAKEPGKCGSHSLAELQNSWPHIWWIRQPSVTEIHDLLKLRTVSTSAYFSGVLGQMLAKTIHDNTRDWVLSIFVLLGQSLRALHESSWS